MTSSAPIILAFAGGLGSDKSTVSSAVAEELGWPRTSFGAYVRAIAQVRKRKAWAREVQQDVGEQLVKEECESFCRAVLSHPRWQSGQPLVVDGIRHVEVLERLRRMVAPQTIRLFFIDVALEERAARLRDEGVDDPAQLRRIESHSTETQVRTVLPHMADLVVDGDRSIEIVARDVVSWVRSGARAGTGVSAASAHEIVRAPAPGVSEVGQFAPSPQIPKGHRGRELLKRGALSASLSVALPLVVTIAGAIIYDLYIKPRLPLLPLAYHTLSSFISAFVAVALVTGLAFIFTSQRRRIAALQGQNDALLRRGAELAGHRDELGVAEATLEREKARLVRQCDNLDAMAALLGKQLALDEAILGFIPYLSLSDDREEALRRCLSEFLDGASALFSNDVFRASIVQPTEIDGNLYLTPLAWSKEMSIDSIRRTKFYVGADLNRRDERGVAGKTFVDETIEVVHFTLENGEWRPDRPDYIVFEPDRRLPYRSCAAVPIGGRRMGSDRTEERPMGVLCFDSPTPDVFDSDEIKELLGALSGGVRATLSIYAQLEGGANVVARTSGDPTEARAGGRQRADAQ
jgi:dephospho-CoA kinase